MKTETALRENIMRRVWMAYFVREATQPMILAVALAVSLFVLGRLVFVAKVFENAALKQDIFGYAGYMLNAFIGTQFIVQLIVVLSATLFAFILKDAAVTLVSSRPAGA